jgi:outer membrane protein assembly factor BamB
MRSKLISPTLVALLIFTGSVFAETPDLNTVQATKIVSGLVVIVEPAEIELAKQLAADGRMAVDLLVNCDEPKAHSWRTDLAKSRLHSQVSVVRQTEFSRLPYPDRFVNLLIADLDALAAKKLTIRECRRVMAPYGTLLLRQKGKWVSESIGLAPDLDEWTHFEHGADGNPVSKDKIVSHVRGLQWASYDIQENPGSTPRIGSGVHARAIVRDRQGSKTILYGREAGNGLLRWQIAESDGQRVKRSEVFEKSWCIAGDRIHGLVGDTDKWAQSIDLTTGKRVVVYDQGIPAPPIPTAKLRFLQVIEEKELSRDVTVGGSTNTRGPYSLGLLHIALQDRIFQGGNVPVQDRKPAEIPLGPPKGKNAPPDAPKSVQQSAAYQGMVVALDPSNGKRLWSWNSPEGLQIAELVGAEETIVVGLTRATIGIGVHYRNRFARLAEVVALDAKTGKQRWRSDHVKDFLIHHVAIVDGGLYVADHHIYQHEGDLRRIVRFDLASGKIEFDATPAIDIKADNWKNRFAILNGRIHLGGTRDLVDFDAKTGKDVKVTKTSMTDYGTKVPGLALGHCSTWRATPNGWLSGRFARFIPFDGVMENRCAVSRNWCDEGHYPAYGLCYSGYHPGCFCSTYLVGHAGLHSSAPPPLVSDEQRLDKGPSWGTPLAGPVGKDQWPTFRADAQRSQFVDAKLGANLTLLGSEQLATSSLKGPLAEDWSNSIFPVISAPVIADDTALVSVVHERRLVAFEMHTGKERWSRPLAGRSLYPPTVYRGLVYLGGQDGAVTCLRLKDGEMVWRFLAAPSQQRVAIASQVESAWPVPGVVVHQDRVYAVAGTHNQLDGGLYVWALDPANGAILGRAVITSGLSNQAPFNKAPAQDYEGRSNDIPSIDRKGRALHIRDIAVDMKTWDWANMCVFLNGQVKEVAGFSREDLAAVFTRLLENHNAMYRPIFLRFAGAGLGIKYNMSWLAWAANSHDLEGSDMAIGPDRAVVIQGGRVVSYALDERGLPMNTPRPNSNIARNLVPGVPLTKDYRPRTAVAMTRDRLVVSQPATSLKPASLVLLKLDGTELATLNLPADPLPANLAIASSQILVGTVDGRMHRIETAANK